MKYIPIPLLGAVLTAVVIPFHAFALSCMPVDMMLENYVNDDRYIIVKATAGDSVEHVEKPAEEDYMFDEGYAGQRIAISESLKGYVGDDMWVYWRVNSTWQYMCAGAPPTKGTENIYVIGLSNDSFGLPVVTDTFPADSELAGQLEADLAEAGTSGEVNETNPARWSERLANELRQMVFILRIKLAEWRFWQGQAE